ncbi:MAG: prefoldin subunit beta [Candidatus Aenigmatarchaeota archaeon]|nr:MAG: prefoldin subunit beta [Candidatus Aenigmarchaeota archaeon]
MAEESKQVQQLLNQAQLYQQQIQNILAQKETLNIQLIEIGKALEELEKTKEGEVYKIAGPILIKSKKADAKKDLKEKEDAIRTRLKTMESGEKRIREKIEDLREKLSGPKKKQAIAE